MRTPTLEGALCALTFVVIASCDGKAAHRDDNSVDASPVDSAEQMPDDEDAAGTPPDEQADAANPGDETDAGGLEMDATVGADGGSSAMMVGNAGGVVRAMNGTASLDIPAGALSAMKMITVTPAATVPAGALGAAIELGPDGTKFDKPVALAITLPAAMLATTDVNNLTVGTFVGGKWQPAPVVFTSANTGKMLALIDHFSIWGIIPRLPNPCVVDVECSKKCCTGTHTGNEVSTTCSHGGLYQYDDCYAKCVGSARVTNYSTGCLRNCCVSNEVSPSGACVLYSEADLDKALSCSRACVNPEEPVTICFADAQRHDPYEHSFCVRCDATTCNSATCQGGAVCKAAGNACSNCEPTGCDASERCGDDYDDDCNGQVDDGCAARKCSRSSDCASGATCSDGYCVQCAASCQQGACTGGRTCQAYGNGCRRCQTCEAAEVCGNDIDDNCNEQIDEGCALRACSRSAQCPNGQSCRSGFCTPCDPCSPSACSAGTGAASCIRSGNGCQECGTCGSREVCGNDRDDNCDGQVDEGCAALRCYASSQCPRGNTCEEESCVACTSRDGCTAAGASCTMSNTEQGRCTAFGNGCFECSSLCTPGTPLSGELVVDGERCGDDRDNDCDNLIDEGCVPCTSGISSTCPVGFHCFF